MSFIPIQLTRTSHLPNITILRDRTKPTLSDHQHQLRPAIGQYVASQTPTTLFPNIDTTQQQSHDTTVDSPKYQPVQLTGVNQHLVMLCPTNFDVIDIQKDQVVRNVKSKTLVCNCCKQEVYCFRNGTFQTFRWGKIANKVLDRLFATKGHSYPVELQKLLDGKSGAVDVQKKRPREQLDDDKVEEAADEIPLKIKVHLGSTATKPAKIYRFSVKTTDTLAHFIETMRGYHHSSVADANITWVDSEGDDVQLLHEKDWQEMISEYRMLCRAVGRGQRLDSEESAADCGERVVMRLVVTWTIKLVQ